MNRNPVRCSDLTILQATETLSPSTSDSATWRRPIITIIDVKRTMFAGGYENDGGTGSL
jgi:hypothetical protein